jgi:hypothetical protein
MSLLVKPDPFRAALACSSLTKASPSCWAISAVPFVPGGTVIKLSAAVRARPAAASNRPACSRVAGLSLCRNSAARSLSLAA